MKQRRGLLRMAALALAVACTACTTASGRGWPAATQRAGPGRGVITVGSFNFPESELLAYLYAGALAGQGYPVRVLPDLGSRELVDPALMAGLIQVVPEYTGSALEFAGLGQQPATASVPATDRRLTRSLAQRDIRTGRPAAAQDGNAIVVTAATAARYHLHTIADLRPVARQLVFGGPPECAERADCLPGLRRDYGLRFRRFLPLDAGGPLTRQALVAGDINVALLFSTDPIIPAQHLVVLADNRQLQPAENIVPVVRRETAARYPGLLAVLDAVSARLSTAVLVSLDDQVQLHGQAARAAAQTWLRGESLAAAGRRLP